ncbi:GerAB/ArcD/ProY family transporter [Metabacillus halosaccharovorans]|uniref:Spore germination protein n=1 Tax=Metabacillus halosaccharovorans TaxID=930124 RepID=A0ABT3DBH0_9BACI|nr:spore germination protein [Metabacillus halosaccharovorans]MCV9884206.1 spore germination protein [Metabacillus halosaccharovorans]
MKSTVSFVNAYIAFFIIHTTQIGMGILGYPRIVYLVAKQDAWISILLSGLFISLITWMIIRILNHYENCNLYEIHENIFGRFIGSIINTVIVIYFIASNYSIIISYVELSLSWGYEGVYEWVGVLALLLVTLYAVSGGFRVVAGVCFLSFLMTIWMIFAMYQPFESLQITRILPILTTPPPEIMEGVFKSSYTMLGFEVLFFIFPFIKEKDKLLFFSQLAVWFTTLLVLFTTVISILFFSSKELEKNIWPLFSMISVVHFPFLERFEYLALSIWILVIFSNLSITLFISSKGVKHIFHVKQKHGIWIISIIIFIMSFFITKRVDIDLFIDQIGHIGFYLWFVYPILLYSISIIKSKILSYS